MILLPGLDGTGRLFVNQTGALSGYFDLRCLAIPESNRQGWKELAEAVIRLIRQACYKRKVYLCGESYGGCLALQILLMAPELLDRLILINPASSLRQQAWLRLTTQASSYVPSWLFAASGTLVFPLLANFERISSGSWQTFATIVRPISQDCVAWRLSMLRDFDVSSTQLSQMEIPTALVASRRDRLLPSLQEAERLKRVLSNTSVYVLPNSGHVCLLEDDVDLVHCLRSLDFLPKPSSIEV